MSRTTENLISVINKARAELAEIHQDNWEVIGGWEADPTQDRADAFFAQEFVGKALDFLDSASKLLTDLD